MYSTRSTTKTSRVSFLVPVRCMGLIHKTTKGQKQPKRTANANRPPLAVMARRLEGDIFLALVLRLRGKKKVVEGTAQQTTHNAQWAPTDSQVYLFII
jgi:hypothetical protein